MKGTQYLYLTKSVLKNYERSFLVVFDSNVSNINNIMNNAAVKLLFKSEKFRNVIVN